MLEQNLSHEADYDPDLNYYNFDGSDDVTSNYYTVDEYNELSVRNASSLQLFNINVRSFQANFDSIVSMFNDDNLPDILLTTETSFIGYIVDCLSKTVQNILNFHKFIIN